MFVSDSDRALLVHSIGPDFEAEGYGKSVLIPKVNANFITKANNLDLDALCS
jgi:hypothetical protein